MSENRPARVIGLGALNIDRIFCVKGLLADGESAVEDCGTFPGGSAANTIFGLARLGVSSAFCGAVGEDENGKLLLSDFKKAGVDTCCISKILGVPSGTVFCLSTSRRRSLYVLAGANSYLCLGSIDLPFTSSSEYLHISSFVDEAQFSISRQIVENLPPYVKLSFSPGALYAGKGMAALKPFFKRTHILFANKNEIEKIADTGYREAAEKCIETGCKVVAVTLGSGVREKGRVIAAYVREEGNEYCIDAGKPLRLKIIDTTGAGDAFAAGFLFGLLENKNLETCGKLGNCAARLSLRYSGARKGLPTRRQLEQYFLKLYGKDLRSNLVNAQ